MPDLVAGLFRTRAGAEMALGKLKEEGFAADQVALATPRIGRRGRYGLKVLIGIGGGALLGALGGALGPGGGAGGHPPISGNLVVTVLVAAAHGAPPRRLLGRLFGQCGVGAR